MEDWGVCRRRPDLKSRAARGHHMDWGIDVRVMLRMEAMVLVVITLDRPGVDMT
jgi:hypothetical protein